MKRLSFFAVVIMLQWNLGFSQVAVNSSGDPPDGSAILDVQSNTKGMLVPRMSISEKDAISNPANGLLIFCTDDNLFYMNRGTAASPDWSVMSSEWISNGSNIYYDNGMVGIGETNPQGRLHVSDPGEWAGIVFTGTGLNDLEVDVSGYSGTGATMYAIRIQNSGPNPNMIEISSDGGSSWSSPIPIAPNIDMDYGVYANYTNAYGHTYDDLWEWTVNESYPDILYIAGGSVNIGSDQAEGSAILKLSSTNKGFLPPCMTYTQRIAITTPSAGLLVFQTDSPIGYYYYNGTNWISIENASATCIDYDGNAYPTITIGTQTWTAENLRVTHYRNGDAIPNVTDNSTWAALTTGAYCWYDNNQSANAKYGALYNWYAVDDSRRLCPEGWRVPTDLEWTAFTTYLGGVEVAGGKMKSVSALWNSPNTDATNSSGFSGLPGGYRFQSDGIFYYIGYDGIWWTSTEGDNYNVWSRSLSNNNPEVYRYEFYLKEGGFSVRCLRDL
ncbi:MAG: fibrobacter succinogenes major paralogous domain-containing protein [Bacteroidales bacterium]|jgi:uncharacterized protein (TIGR02145 family)